MKPIQLLFLFTIMGAISPLYAAQESCTPPKLIAKLENYEIIATNQSIIKAGANFSGSALTYSLRTHPKNHANKVTINAQTGDIEIDAEAKDHFDIFVQAKNGCGNITSSFNVIIDEEE